MILNIYDLLEESVKIARDYPSWSIKEVVDEVVETNRTLNLRRDCNDGDTK